jgi:hypothetical protein
MKDHAIEPGTETPRVLFFDNNFIRPFLKGEFGHETIDENSEIGIALQPPFKVWRTPFSFMELVGLNPKRWEKPAPFPFDSVPTGDLIEPAYHHYSDHFRTVSDLQDLSLAERARLQKEQVNADLRSQWEPLVNALFDSKGIASWLRFALCFDAVHKLPSSGKLRARLHSELVASAFFKADCPIRNLSKFRLAFQMWLKTQETMTGPTADNDQRACILEAHGLIKIRNWEDYLDGDLVHAAVYGAELEDGSRLKVTCLTCDSPEAVTMRLRLYKGFLEYVRALYKEPADAEGAPTDYESSHNGKVLCFDSKGRLVRAIDVSTDAPPLPFLGKLPASSAEE